MADYRKENGDFKSVEDLKKVKGIGEGIFGKLKDEATVGSAPNAKAAKPAAPAAKK
ncbi:ComEA family DNA-binding protein [Neisseria sp. KEM232]|uniref:ComEA family DNA-binding protein n=1 Tax=Neisseria sp. KEM232 TaxID=655307 RepID=UPI003519C495